MIVATLNTQGNEDEIEQLRDGEESQTNEQLGRSEDEQDVGSDEGQDAESESDEEDDEQDDVNTAPPMS